ncbi:MAG TPA: hypothetical protein PLI11_01325 [Clostridia bacterium]|jgi:hypothetical protein|nr:hypothetical protein [Clostridia bacterium]HPZ51535.1 hypothetical protein [Clostridia bacterium]
MKELFVALMCFVVLFAMSFELMNVFADTGSGSLVPINDTMSKVEVYSQESSSSRPKSLTIIQIILLVIFVLMLSSVIIIMIKRSKKK